MSEQAPFGDAPAETLILKLAAEPRETEVFAFLEDARRALPLMNWRAHIFLVDGDPVGGNERAAHLIRMAGEYLAEQPLATLYVHPLLSISAIGTQVFEDWEEILRPVRAFQREAYDRQGEVRLMVLPIVEVRRPLPEGQILGIASFFRERFSRPSFYFRGASLLSAETVSQNDLRVYVDPAEGFSPQALMDQLRINQAFEHVLQWIEEGSSGPLAPCGRLLIMDQERGQRYPCFVRWERGQPGDTLEAGDFRDCPECMGTSCLRMKANIEANGRVPEGRQAALALASVFSGEGKWAEGASQARRAFEFSMRPDEKATALLHEGLCLLNLGEGDRAEAVLEEGSGYSADRGPFEYHLGSLAFSRRDYSEAAGRFEKALASGSPNVSRDDALFNRALSLINQGDFPAARVCLDRMEKLTLPVWFYRGVCDLGLGMPEAALADFEKALAQGPAPEDLSRVHFYKATCLKEMSRYDDAIGELERAIEADPEEYLNYNLLGFCFYQLRRFEEAIKALHRAIEKNPLSAIDYASIGSSLRELGRLEDAVAMYAMALSLDPDLGFARENMTRLKEILNRGDQSPE